MPQVQKIKFAEIAAPERIKFAAIRVQSGDIYSGYSHAAAIQSALALGVSEDDLLDVCDGFITSYGRFVGRDEAYEIATQSNQVSKDPESASNTTLELHGEDIIAERMNFDQLFAFSEPKRILRSRHVRGPSLDIESYSDSMMYFFNFKAVPSTTGKRWKGYIRFHKPEDPDTPLEKVDCEVDCGCPDYKYRFAWSNSQRDAGQIGPDSINKSIDRAPRITNPTNTPGLCKHLLALRNFLYGQDSRFPPSDDTGTSDRLSRLVSAANGTTIDDAGQSLASGDPEAFDQALNRRRTNRRHGREPEEPEPDVPDDLEEPEEEPEEVDEPEEVSPEPEVPSNDNPQNPTTQNNPTNPRNESLSADFAHIVTNMNRTEVVKRIMEQTGIASVADVPPVPQPTPTPEVPAIQQDTPADPSERALAHLAGIENLMKELVGLEKAEKDAIDPKEIDAPPADLDAGSQLPDPTKNPAV